MWYNPIMKSLLKSPLHIFVSRNMMLIQYTGRKSGKTFTTPVSYFPAQDEQGEYLATTSVSERVWWRNLRGGAPISIHLKGKEIPASAEVYENPDNVSRGLAEFILRSPQYAKYFQVALDENGQPNAQDIARSAQGKVLIKTRLRPSL